MNNIHLPLKFNYTERDIVKIEKDIIETNNSWLQYVKKNELSSQEFLDSYLYKNQKFDYIYNVISFLQYSSKNKKIREASSNFDIKISEYFLNFYKSIDNYKLFLILNKIKDDPIKKELVKKILHLFEKNGVSFNHIIS